MKLQVLKAMWEVRAIHGRKEKNALKCMLFIVLRKYFVNSFYILFLHIFTSLIFFTHSYLFVAIYIYANSTSYI